MADFGWVPLSEVGD